MSYHKDILSLSSSNNFATLVVYDFLKGFEMTKDDITLLVGQRWASALKKQFGAQNTAKEIARVFDIEIRTARSWLAGTAPYMKHLWIAGQKLGPAFLADLLTPNSKWKKYADIDKALDLMEENICRLREEIRDLSSTKEDK